MRKQIVGITLLVLIIIMCVACDGKQPEQEEGKKVNHESIEKVLGNWEGEIQAVQPLSVELTLDDTASSLNVPIQGLFDVPITVELEGQQIKMKAVTQGETLVFDGNVTEDLIEGVFVQGVQKIPFSLTPASEKLGEPFTVQIKEEDFQARLLLPEGEGPFPAVVIIAGSGPTNMDGNTIVIPGKNDSLKLLAELAQQEGYAVIRYDKRGVGENRTLIKNEENHTFTDFVNDANALVEWAQQEERITTVGVMGHSEGSIIGTLTSKETAANFFVSIAGPGRKFDVILEEQLQKQLPEELFSQAKKIIADLSNGQQVEHISPELQAVFRPAVQPIIISMMAIDPAASLRQLQQPVLIVSGGHDLQVTEEDAKLLASALPQATSVRIPNMNHVLKDAPSEREENLATYSDSRLPLSPELVQQLRAFLRAQLHEQ